MDAEGHDSSHVFADTEGNYLRMSNFYRRSFQPTLQRAGLPPTRLHDLRHTCATLLLLVGVNIKVVSERPGHADVKITLDIYSHVLPTMQELAVQKLETMFRTPAQLPASVLPENGSSLAVEQGDTKSKAVATVDVNRIAS